MNSTPDATFSCKQITAADLKSRLLGDKVPTLIDVRTESEYHEAHIPGTKLIPLDTLKSVSLAQFSASDIVLICKSGMRAERAAKILTEQGYSNLMVLQYGTLGWIEADLPVERGARNISPSINQMRIVIGLIILIGSVLALTVTLWFAFIPATAGLLLLADIAGIFKLKCC